MQTIIVVVYLVAMVGIGVALRSRISSASDFLVAGGKLGLLLTTATFAATNLGAGVILGGAELAAQFGLWAGTWPGISVGGGLIFAGFVAARKLRKRGSFVPLDFFARRYGDNRVIRLWAWGSNIPSLIGILGIQFMATGTVAEIFGVSFETGVWATGGVVLICSMLGGLWGAVVTDLIQIGLIAIAIPVLAFTTSLALGTGVTPVSVSGLLATDFIPEGTASIAVFNILPFLLMGPVSYDAYLRFQSARSADTAKWGAVLGGAGRDRDLILRSAGRRGRQHSGPDDRGAFGCASDDSAYTFPIGGRCCTHGVACGCNVDRQQSGTFGSQLLFTRFVQQGPAP